MKGVICASPELQFSDFVAWSFKNQKNRFYKATDGRLEKGAKTLKRNVGADINLLVRPRKRLETLGEFPLIRHMDTRRDVEQAHPSV
jgi:hypothetical protein